MTAHELILYLTPKGDLGEHCNEFFRVSRDRFGPTEAHTYPPHVTLTGFFRRARSRRAAAVREVNAALEMCAANPPPKSVSVVGLHATESWVGLAIESPWAQDVTGQVMTAHRTVAAEDDLRPKDWLHLSLAYGLSESQQLDDFASLAEQVMDPAAHATWRVDLWERHTDGSWTCL